MKDLHPSQALLAAYARDELPSPRRRKIGRHVVLCSACQRRLSRLEREAEEATGAVDYDSAIRRAAETALSLKESIDEEARRSASLLPELLREPPERRLERVDESRFHSLKLCQLFQERSRLDWFEEPARGLESARLAVAIADHLDAGRYGSGLVAEERARAWALLGNSLRINRNLRGAEQALQQAAGHHRLTGDPLVECEILSFTASLRFTQDRRQDAIRLLDRAAAISREIGDGLQEGRALTMKGRALKDDGRYREALRYLRQARRLLGAEPEAEAVALYNLLVCLVDMGHPREAQRLLERERHRYLDLGRRRLLANLHCLEALIAEGLGRPEDAIPLFWRARELYEEQQLPFDWAVGSFQLVAALLGQGSRAEARRLLEELIPVLDFMEIQPEAGFARMIYLRCR